MIPVSCGRSLFFEAALQCSASPLASAIRNEVKFNFNSGSLEAVCVVCEAFEAADAAKDQAKQAANQAGRNQREDHFSFPGFNMLRVRVGMVGMRHM